MPTTTIIILTTTTTTLDFDGFSWILIDFDGISTLVDGCRLTSDTFVLLLCHFCLRVKKLLLDKVLESSR